MKVKFFAHLQAFTSCDETDVPAPCEMTSDQLWEALEEKFPGIERFKTPTRLARNFTYVTADSVFKEGDEVALIPPVSGG